MYKSWKRITAALLSVLMCMNGIISPVYAEGEELPEETVMPEETPAAEEPAEAAEEAEPEAEETEPEEAAEAPGEAAEETAPQEDAEEASVPMASEDEPLDVQVFGTCTADGKEAETEFELNYYAVDYDVQAGNEPFTVDTENGAFETADSVYADGPYTAYLVAAPNEGYLYCPTAYRIEYEVSGEEYTCTVKRGTINDPENDDIFDEANYTEDADWENLTFDFVSAEKPVFSPKAEVFLDDEVPADGLFEFELRDEDGTVLETASNIGKSVDFNYEIILDGSDYVTYSISQSTEDDGSRLLDNAEFTWALRSDWNWDTYEYEKSIELQDEAGVTVSFYDTDPTLPVFRNYSEENTVTLDEPLTVRVETDDPSLENREFKIEFNCLSYDRKVTFTTSGHEINYGFDKFTYSEVFEFEIKLVAEDDLICEDTYIYHIPVESDTDTDELLIVDPYLTKDGEEVSEAVFHVSKDGSDTPDPDDELLEEIERLKQEYEKALADLDVANQELAAAESALSAAEGALNDAKADAAAKASAVTAAQDALDAKDAKIAEKTTAYNNAVTAKNKAQEEYDKAEKEYEDLKEAQGESGLETLEAQKAEAEKAVKDAQAQIDMGSLGYFKANGSTTAVQIITENLPESRKCTLNAAGDRYSCEVQMGQSFSQPIFNLGQEHDPTSLENMKAAFDWIRTGNKLRLEDKNFDCTNNLKVNDTLMAVAQAQLSASRLDFDHSKIYLDRGALENLAWGMGQDPYDGWYYEEKATYDNNNNAPYNEVGHYLTLVTPGFVNTGYACTSGPATLPNGKEVSLQMDYQGMTFDLPLCHSQVFSRGTEIDNNDPTTKSVDEYEAHFLNYCDEVEQNLADAEAEVARIQKLIDEYDAGEDPVAVALKVAEKKKQELEAAKAAEAAAKTAMEAEQAEREALVTNLQNAQQEKDAADQTVTEKQDAYDAAKKTRDDAQAKVNAAQAVVDEKLAAYNEAKSKLISVTDIQVKSESLTMHYNETGKLTATVVPEDAYYKGVKWESLNPEIVEITETGRYHALREGDTVLTVSSSEPESTVSKTISVHVNAPAINGFKKIPNQTVESGTEPDYPDTVTALYEDDTEKEVSVIWEELAEEQYGIREGGTFDVKGTVEGTTLRPCFSVTVRPAEVDDYTGPKEFWLRVNGDLESILPENGNFLYSNGDITNTWIDYPDLEDADVSVPGDLEIDAVIFEGTDDQFWFTLTVHVYEPEIASIDRPETITVESGKEPVYPGKVHVHYKDDIEEDADVVWNKLSKEEYSVRAGKTYTVKGTVEGTAIEPELTIVVKPATIRSIGQFDTVRTRFKTAPVLPKTAHVTWSNEDVSDETVTWNSILASSYAKAGTFTATGHISDAEGNEAEVSATVEVYEPKIESFDAIENQTINSGNEPVYPETVTAHFDDDVTEAVSVEWQKLTKEQYGIREGGEFTVTGTVEGADLKPEFKVTVNPAAVSSYVGFETIKTKEGVYPVLPESVTLHWSNEDVTTASVTWDDIPEEQYAKAGKFTVRGKAKASETMDEPVSAVVEVYEVKITSIDDPEMITVPSGTEPAYPATVHVYYNDNSEGVVPVTWEKLTKEQYGIREGGEYTVTGTVEGFDEKSKLSIIVKPAEPKGIEDGAYRISDDFVIVAGQKPIDSLPNELDVEWTNGDVTKERIAWDEEASDVLTEPGTVDVHGTITVSGERDYKVVVHVSVIDAGDVTPEDAEQVGFIIPEGLWAARDDKTLVYNGTAQTFSFRVYNGNRLLANKKDYTFKYSNNKNAGIHDLEEGAKLNWKPAKKEKKPYITITGKGNYSGKIYVPFDILPVSEELTTVPSISVKYNKKVQKPSPAVLYNRTTLKKGTDYTLTYLQGEAECPPKEPGSYTIHVQGKGNYEGSYADVLMTIEETPKLASGFNVKVPNVKYEDIQDKEAGLTAEELKDLVKVTYGKDKKEVTYGSDYEFELANAKSVGKATLYVKGINGYTGTKTVTFNITGVPIKNATSLIVTSQPYTGGQIKPAELTNTNLVEGTDYELVYTNNTNAGKATVTLKGIGNYTGSIKKTFKILPKELDNTFTVSVKDAVYVKGGAKPAVTVTHDGKALKAGTDYTVKYSGNKKPGKGTATITGKGNYKGTIKEDFAIDYADLSKVTVTVADKVSAAKMYSAVTLTDSDGKKLKAGTDYIKPSNSSYTYVNDTELTNGTERKAGEPVQPKDIAPADTWIQVTVISDGNYTGTAVAKYRILEKGHDLSKAKVQFVKDGKTVKSLSKEYTGKPVKLEKSDLVVKVGGVVLNENDYVILDDYANNVNKGTATVTIAGKGGYGGTKTVKFKIGAEKMTVWETLAGLFGN